MFAGREATQVVAAFGDDGQDRQDVQAGDLGQIESEALVEKGACIELHFVFAWLAPFAAYLRHRGGVCFDG